MSILNSIGTSQLLAFDGQRQAAAGLAKLVNVALHRAGQFLAGHSAETLLP